MTDLFIYSYDDLRAIIKVDGTVFKPNEGVIGYINEDGTSGDINQNFIGEINSDGTILNKNDEIVGYVDLGRSTIRDETDSHFSTILRDGTILDRNESNIGYIKNFTYFHLKVVSAYLMIFDRQFFDLKYDNNHSPIHDSNLIDLPSFSDDDSHTYDNYEYYEDFKNDYLEFCSDDQIDVYYIKILNLGCPVSYVRLCKQIDEVNKNILILSRKVIVDKKKKEIIHKIKVKKDINIMKYHIDAIYKRNKDQLDIYIHTSEELDEETLKEIQIYEIQEG